MNMPIIDDELEACTDIMALENYFKQHNKITPSEQIACLREYMEIMYYGKAGNDEETEKAICERLKDKFLNTNWRRLTDKYLRHDFLSQYQEDIVK